MKRRSLRILGIDPGTRRTGYGWLESGPGVVRAGCGVLCARGEVPDRLLLISRELEALLGRLRPDIVAVEEAFYGKDVRSLLRIGEVRGAILAAVRGRGIPVEQFAPAVVKLSVTGSGRASKTQVASMVARILGPSVRGASPDATDALAVAICCSHRVPLRKRRRWASGAWILALGGLRAFSAQAPSLDLDEEVAAQVLALGSEGFESRERAFQRLLDLGARSPETVLERLPQDSPQAEVRARCEVLRRWIPTAAAGRRAIEAAGESPEIRQAIGNLTRAIQEDPAAHLTPLFQTLLAAAEGEAAKTPGILAPFLAHPEAGVRESALTSLWQSVRKWGSPSAPDPQPTAEAAKIVPLFLQLLKDPAPRIRIGAARILGSLKDPAAVGGLLLLLEDPDPAARGNAATALARFQDPATRGPIEKLLADRNASVRVGALQALAILGGVESESALSKSLEDADPGVRTQAAQSLVRLRAAQPEGLAALLKHANPLVRVWAVRSLRTAQAATVGMIAPLLSDPDPEVRGAADMALCSFRDGAHLADLLKLLASEDPFVRGSAVRALGSLQAPGASDAVARMLADPDPEVRMRAIVSMFNLRDRSHLADILRLIDDEDDAIRERALWFLAQLAPPSEPDSPFAPLLSDPDPQVRGRAQRFLQHCKESKDPSRAGAPPPDGPTATGGR